MTFRWRMARAGMKGVRRSGCEVGMAGMALRACKPGPSGLAMSRDCGGVQQLDLFQVEGGQFC